MRLARRSGANPHSHCHDHAAVAMRLILVHTFRSLALLHTPNILIRTAALWVSIVMTARSARQQ